MYAMRIDNYSAKELQVIFDKHISNTAEVLTDKWKGYRPLQDEYNIEQIESYGGLNFQKLHAMIHQITSWIRTTYSWVSPFHIDRYFDGFCYRLNRSQSKNSIFNNLMKRMVIAPKMYQHNLVCA